MVPIQKSNLGTRQGYQPYDVAVIGAGPVGLAIAGELARLGFDVTVLDRRMPLAQDENLRRQLLVARPGDLANLVCLGVDVRDPSVVSPLTVLTRHDLLNGHTTTATAGSHLIDLEPSQSLFESVHQAPVALVPIGRLQQALLSRAIDLGVDVRYQCQVTRIKRHARHASLHVGEGKPVMAKVAIVATGAARSLIDPSDISSTLRQTSASRSQQPMCRNMIGGVFESNAPTGQWTRAEIPLESYGTTLRCTMLATGAETAAGTALLVDAPVDVDATPRMLRRYFELAAEEFDLEYEAFATRPRVFPTAVTEVRRRVIAGDNRAPILVAGDAAQTGHVFTGLNCMVNLALALELCRLLAPARKALVAGKYGSPKLTEALDRYQLQSETGATRLHEASRPHFAAHNPGAWALP